MHKRAIAAQPTAMPIHLARLRRSFRKTVEMSSISSRFAPFTVGKNTMLGITPER